MATLYDRVVYAIRRRPLRVVEAVIAVAAAAGVTLDIDPEVVVGVLVAVGVVGGEVAQTQTTPTADPSLEHEVPDDLPGDV